MWKTPERLEKPKGASKKSLWITCWARREKCLFKAIKKPIYLSTDAT